MSFGGQIRPECKCTSAATTLLLLLGHGNSILAPSIPQQRDMVMISVIRYRKEENQIGKIGKEGKGKQQPVMSALLANIQITYIRRVQRPGFCRSTCHESFGGRCKPHP